MLQLDGSMGEGGGQILRSALSLSLVTGEPFRIVRIRAGRDRPGLLRQHLTAVQAAAAVGRAAVEGASLGSSEITFRPGHAQPGDYTFAVGTAGSATLVAQTVLPALLTAEGHSSVTATGGTHNPSAPPFEFLQHAFLPILNRMGPRVEAVLHRMGFYPAGGGSLTVHVKAASRLESQEILEPGRLRRIRVEATVANLPRHIAEREVQVAAEMLALPSEARSVRETTSPAGAGNFVTIYVESERITEVFTGFGKRGVSAEIVGREVAAAAGRYLAAGVTVGEHMADQLLLPFALAGGGSFTTLPQTRHTATNTAVIERFLPVRVTTRPLEKERWLVELR